MYLCEVITKTISTSKERKLDVDINFIHPSCFHKYNLEIEQELPNESIHTLLHVHRASFTSLQIIIIIISRFLCILTLDTILVQLQKIVKKGCVHSDRISYFILKLPIKFSKSNGPNIKHIISL